MVTHVGILAKSEIRNSKPETNPKHEIPKPKTNAVTGDVVDIRISDLFRISCFEFRIYRQTPFWQSGMRLAIRQELPIATIAFVVVLQLRLIDLDAEAGPFDAAPLRP